MICSVSVVPERGRPTMNVENPGLAAARRVGSARGVGRGSDVTLAIVISREAVADQRAPFVLA
jgi:hypothetical protein